MFAAIAELAPLLAKGLIDHVKNKQAIEQAVTQRKIELAKDQMQYNHDWEMAQLKDADWFTRRVSFLIIIFPAVITMIHPAWGDRIFQTFDTLPTWYTEAFGTIMFAVWGIHATKNPLLNIISAVKNSPTNPNVGQTDGSQQQEE